MTKSLTCEKCGKSFTHDWPGSPRRCLECRYAPPAELTRTCEKCGCEFAFKRRQGPRPSKCPPCKSAKEPRKNAWKHGSITGYRTHRCRCAPCREAERVAKGSASLTVNCLECGATFTRPPRRGPVDKCCSAACRDHRADRLKKARRLQTPAPGGAVRNANYRSRNKERIAAQRSSPEGRERSRANRRRRREREAERHCGCETPETLAAVWALDGNRCAYCGGPGTDTDHVIPLSRGGWGCIWNYRVACDSCNSKKWAFSRSDFLARLKAAGILIRPGATNSGLPCPAAAARMAVRMLPASPGSPD